MFILLREMGWLPPAPDGIAMCQDGGAENHEAEGTATVTKDMMIGADLAKRVFQLHGASMAGHVQFRRRLTRGQFRTFMAAQPPAIVVMEACGSAHYGTREITALGNEVRLIAPFYVKPFLKRHKNDAADAEAIVEAAQRPGMRFVEPKGPDQQARAMLFRVRDQMVHLRTELLTASGRISTSSDTRFRSGSPASDGCRRSSSTQTATCLTWCAILATTCCSRLPRRARALTQP